MTAPIALCLERIGADADFTSCVALAAGQPGLGLEPGGMIAWRSTEGLACTLSVEDDGELWLTRAADAGPITLVRAGRSVELEPGQAVVLLAGDLVELASGTRYRLHLHGEAPAVVPPERVELEPEPEQRSGSTGWQRAAAAAVLGMGLLGGAGCKDAEATPNAAVPVRTRPPKVAPPEDISPIRPPSGDATVTPPTDVGPTPVPKKTAGEPTE